MRTRLSSLAAILFALYVLTASAFAARPAGQAVTHRAPSDTAATARYLASIQHQPLLQLAFFREMPKGADLHNHLSGAIYAESFLRWAAQGGLCIARTTMTAVPPPCDAAAGKPAAAAAYQDDLLYRQVIDAWSMRDFVPSSGDSGHDHFFDTFAKFGLADKGHDGDMLAEVMHNAATQHLEYLELMDTLAGGPIGQLAQRTGWDPNFARLRARLMPGMPAVVADAQHQLDAMQQKMRADLNCGSHQADPGCAVKVRFLYQVLRGLPPRIVFAQILTGFELASHDRRVVGLNLVMPEDGEVAMRDFRLHMAMLDYLHGIYPGVHIALHAGGTGPGHGTPRRTALSHPRLGGTGTRRAHRPRRRHHARRPPLPAAPRDGAPPRAGGDLPDQQPRHPRHQR